MHPTKSLREDKTLTFGKLLNMVILLEADTKSFPESKYILI